MTPITVSLIVAVAKNGVIGAKGTLAWHSSADMAHFKRTTRGHAIIMGRRTWQSLPTRPLPDRHNIVVSSRPDLDTRGGVRCAFPDQALDAARQWSEANRMDQLFIIGGASLYEWALPLAGRMYLTEVDCEPQGDVFFPVGEVERLWRQVDAHRPSQSKSTDPEAIFRIMERRIAQTSEQSA